MIRSLLSVSYRGVAQFGRALRSGRRGRKFESCRLDDKKCRISFIEILHFFYFLLFFFLFHFSSIRLQCRLKFQKSEKSEKKCKLVIANFLSFCYNSGHGGIAQLGERLNGIQEVMGSNPTISMSHMLKVLIVQGFQHIFLFKYSIYSILSCSSPIYGGNANAASQKENHRSNAE